MIVRNYFIVILTVLCSSLLPAYGHSAEPEEIAGYLVINEVYIDTTNPGISYLEVYNPTQDTLTLGAINMSGVTTPNLLPDSIQQAGGIPMPGRTFLIISNWVSGFNNYWQIDSHIPVTSGFIFWFSEFPEGHLYRIGNINDSNPLDDLIVGSMSDSATMQKGRVDYFENGVLKYQRKIDGWDTDQTNDDFVITTTPTPGQPNASIPTGIDDIEGTTPDQFALFPNYPNPFNPETSIRYIVPQSAHTTITVYDLLGRRVSALVDGYQAAGTHVARWAGRDRRGVVAPSGVYVYRMETSTGFVESRNMLLVK